MPEENMEDVTSNTTNDSNLINVVRGIKSYTGERPEGFADWHRKTGFILSMQRPDLFAARRHLWARSLLRVAFGISVCGCLVY